MIQVQVQQPGTVKMMMERKEKYKDDTNAAEHKQLPQAYQREPEPRAWETVVERRMHMSVDLAISCSLGEDRSSITSKNAPVKCCER
ncbi:hypothetical protein GJAV_G00211300 [Gymnothorax javanicus]|nr:hypothetical protein GJAV_G00211300 [Gymnothorax javanicus]